MSVDWNTPLRRLRSEAPTWLSDNPWDDYAAAFGRVQKQLIDAHTTSGLGDEGRYQAALHIVIGALLLAKRTGFGVRLDDFLSNIPDTDAERMARIQADPVPYLRFSRDLADFLNRIAFLSAKDDRARETSLEDLLAELLWLPRTLLAH